MNMHLSLIVNDPFENILASVGIPPAYAGQMDDDIRDNLEAHISGAAPNTLAAFKADIIRWFAWSQVNDVNPLQPRPRHIKALIREYEIGRKPNTVKRLVANVGVFVEAIMGWGNITRTKIVSSEMKRVRREKGSDQRHALAIRQKGDVARMSDRARPFSIACMIAALKADRTLWGARARFLLSLGGDTGRRNSEYRDANHCHIVARPGGRGILVIPRSKTDQEGHGSRKFLCRRTMRLYREWKIALAAAGGDISADAPLLVSVDRWGHPQTRLSIAGFNVALRGAVSRALTLQQPDHPELTDELIENILEAVSGHSFRVGIVEDFTTSGESVVAICVEGDWKTMTMPILYARSLSPETGAAARLRQTLGDEEEENEDDAA